MLLEGDVFEIEQGDRVYVYLPAHMWPKNMNRAGDISLVADWGMAQCEVTVGEELRGGPSDFLLGRYVVTDTSTTGGGIGMGPHDVFPDGYQVKAQHVIHPKLRISFFQSGRFTCLLPNKKATGRATATWSVHPKE